MNKFHFTLIKLFTGIQGKTGNGENIDSSSSEKFNDKSNEEEINGNIFHVFLYIPIL